MQWENVNIFISCTSSDFPKVQPILRRLETCGWRLVCSNDKANGLSLPACLIEDCDLVLAFVSADYIVDKSAFVSELSYAACAQRKPYILVSLEPMTNLPPDMEMLAAKDGFIAPEKIESALERWVNTPLKELSPINEERRYALKPFEACEKHYAFVSYAHDDALEVYPIIEELYKSGWNLWYDEGIRITERYLPEIAQHVRDCEIFLLFVTECSIRRPFVIDFELAYALKLGKKIVPVIMEMVERLPDGTEGLSRVAPDATMFEALKVAGIKNYGKRVAIPPKDKKGEEYDLKQLTPMKDYKYRLSGDGLWLTKYIGDENHIVVPENHCNLPICGMDGTFYKQGKINTIHIPASVKYIGKTTFRGCDATVLLPHPENKYSFEKDLDFLGYGCRSGILACFICFIAVVLGSILLDDFWKNLGFLSRLTITMVISIFTLIVSIIVFIYKGTKEREKKNDATLQFADTNSIKNDEDHIALASYANDKQIRDIINDIRGEGFLISHYTGEREPTSNINILIVFLNPDFFKNHKLMREINNAITQNIRIIPIYHSMHPSGLPHEFASTIGQFQGIQYGSPEFFYLIKRALKINNCWRDISNDFDYSISSGKIKIKSCVGKNKIICIPAYIFDNNHIVTQLGYNCFRGATPRYDFTELFIPETIRKISVPVFTINRNSLEYIHVNHKNKFFYSIDGILYNSKKKILVCCPRGISNSFLLTNRVQSIGNCSFELCVKIEEVIIQEGVVKIGNYAFWNCISLNSIFIPNSIKKIGKDAFVCSNPTNEHGYANVHYTDFYNCPNLTIHTPTGSYAEKYAQKNNIPCKTYTTEEWGKLRNNHQFLNS